MRVSLAFLPLILPLVLPLAALWLALAGAASAAPPSGLGLTVTVGPAAVRAAGAVPAAFDLDELARRVPGIDLADAAEREDAGGTDWARALDALTVVLPRLAEGEARLGPGRLEVAGRLRPGFSAEATRSALRLALGAGWEARLDLAEAPPPAKLTLRWTPEGSTAGGILPEGLAPEAALALMAPEGGLAGDEVAGDGLTGGGDGDPAAWRAALAALGRLLPAFRRAEVTVAPGRLEVAGRLALGQDAARLGDWLAGTLGEGWEVAFTAEETPAEETPAAEGVTRHDPVTGGRERLVGGRWLTLHDFAPSPAACRWRGAGLLARATLRFVPGDAELAGEDAAETLDRLAGLARHCLSDGGIRLEIGGHTDSKGDPAENRALSEQRAMTVLLELAARGVRADAMQAVGHGARRAIAGNDSPEGRARNRRITLDWSR